MKILFWKGSIFSFGGFHSIPLETREKLYSKQQRLWIHTWSKTHFVPKKEKIPEQFPNEKREKSLFSQATAAPSAETTSTAAAEAAGSGGPSAVPSGGSGEVWSGCGAFWASDVFFHKFVGMFEWHFVWRLLWLLLCCPCVSIYDACPFRWCHFDFSQTLRCVTIHGANLSLQVPTSRRVSGNRSTLLENLGRVHLVQGDSLCYIHGMPS